jgi:hypothetical protein
MRPQVCQHGQGLHGSVQVDGPLFGREFPRMGIKHHLAFNVRYHRRNGVMPMSRIAFCTVLLAFSITSGCGKSASKATHPDGSSATGGNQPSEGGASAPGGSVASGNAAGGGVAGAQGGTINGSGGNLAAGGGPSHQGGAGRTAGMLSGGNLGGGGNGGSPGGGSSGQAGAMGGGGAIGSSTGGAGGTASSGSDPAWLSQCHIARVAHCSGCGERDCMLCTFGTDQERANAGLACDPSLYHDNCNCQTNGACPACASTGAGGTGGTSPPVYPTWLDQCQKDRITVQCVYNDNTSLLCCYGSPSEQKAGGNIQCPVEERDPCNLKCLCTANSCPPSNCPR